jgi:molybdopterin/thiamine biosynthesis adenylyltransferase/nitroreductase
MTAADGAAAAFRARILDEDEPDDRRLLDDLRADPTIEVVDLRADLLGHLRQLRPTPDPDVLAEPTAWAYLPWRRSVVGILGPRGYRALRLDRNRNLITADEQHRLGGLVIGVAGLSVGHAIAHALGAEGLCGTIRLADFDHLELSNLNRVPATLLDIGVNKAVVAARRLAELDPYLDAQVMTSGLTPDTLGEFLDGLDIVVEECDSLAMKVMVREAARAQRIPVLMATSDRGLIDVERFDLEPNRPIMHGLLGEVDATRLSDGPSRENIPYMLRHLDPSRSSQRFTASLVEMGRTLSSWPQLAGDVVLGAAAVAEAVRRIGLREPLASGQIRIDIGQALDSLHGEQAPVAVEPPADVDSPPKPADESVPAVDVIAAAAVRAPSGGNAQPWTIQKRTDSVVIDIAPQYTSSMDVGFRGSAVALGAAVFNARVAAAAQHVLGPVSWEVPDGTVPLRATLQLGSGTDAALAELYQPMLRRETSRRRGVPAPIPADTVAALDRIALAEGARLSLLVSRDELEQAARTFAATDRIRYLTAQLHRELISELRWPGDEPADSGIDVQSLELDTSDLAVLDILKRDDVMAMLATWDAGEALGDAVRDGITAASALGVITVQGRELTDFARGGSATEAVWIAAERHGLAVQPISPAFLHAITPEELRELSPDFGSELHRHQSDFRGQAGTEPDESQVLVLKFAHAGPTSVTSRRRRLP